MKTSAQTLTLAVLSLLLVLSTSFRAQAGNDTLRLIARVNAPMAQANPTHLLTQPQSLPYFSDLMRRPVSAVNLKLPPIQSHLLSRWNPLGPAKMPVQDFVFTRFTLAKPVKRR